MRAQVLRSVTPAFEATGEASGRLWTMLNQELQGSDPAQVEPADQLPLSLMGRCLVPDGIHFVCETAAVTARGLKITCEALADPGDAILTNFRGLGEIAGVVQARGDSYFVMDIRETPDRLAILSKRIAWHMRLQSNAATDRRASVRFEQSLRKVHLKTVDGRESACELLDLSATGAAVRLGATAPYFWIGQAVVLDNRAGRVRRHFPSGLGVEFDEAREVVGVNGDPLELAPPAKG